MAPQTDSPVGQAQLPDVHVAPVGHAVLQSPQWASSLARSTQVLPHTSGRPSGQRQFGASQTSFVFGHEMPQPPQLRGSVSLFVHASPHRSGYADPGTHWHVPPAHPSFTLWHTFPHAPQFRGSFCVSAQRGFAVAPHDAYAPQSHVPPLHAPGPQEIPHPPQFAGSAAYVAGSVQIPRQSSCP